MTQLRYLFAIATIWFFSLYNIERLAEPINIASFVYVFVAFCALLITLLPRLQRMPAHWLYGGALVAFIALKYELGYSLLGQNLPLTVTEVCVIGVTMFLATQIGQRLEDLRAVVTNLTIGQAGAGTQAFEEGQGQIYREVRRARRHQRPVTLLAIGIAEDTTGASAERFRRDVPLRRFITEIEKELVEKYTQTRVAEVLIDHFEDSAVITQRDDHFVTLLPETNQEAATEIVSKLQKTLTEKMGLQLKVGVSTFPDEAVTFENLLERAEAKMAGVNVNTAPVTNSFRNVARNGSTNHTGANSQVKFSTEHVNNAA
jgi:pyridoxine 5'-phosphate synthase PdxJ